jgi:hypothetical protein
MTMPDHRVSAQREEDLRLLEDLLCNHDHALSATELEAFAGMRDDLLAYASGKGFRELTEPRRSWLQRTLARVAPQYENLVSRGLVPRGREVPTPAVLQKLPMKPPRKRTED